MSDFVMNTDPIKVQINIHPRTGKTALVTHTLRRPTFLEEEKREMMMPIITQETHAKVDADEGTAAQTLKFDDETANTWLYNEIAISVEGAPYGLAEETSVREDFKGSPLIDEIPSTHKSTAIYGMFPADFSLDVGLGEDEEFVFALGTARNWNVKQEIGGKVPQEDGTLTAPDYTVVYALKEPSQKERKSFKLSAMSNSPYIDKTGLRVDRQSANLKVLSEIFDKLVVSVDGALFTSDPDQEEPILVKLDVKNTDHLASIPATYKKQVVRLVFNALEADLGN